MDRLGLFFMHTELSYNIAYLVLFFNTVFVEISAKTSYQMCFENRLQIKMEFMKSVFGEHQSEIS
jgi:hypothetical protein